MLSRMYVSACAHAPQVACRARAAAPGWTVNSTLHRAAPCLLPTPASSPAGSHQQKGATCPRMHVGTCATCPRMHVSTCATRAAGGHH